MTSGRQRTGEVAYASRNRFDVSWRQGTGGYGYEKQTLHNPRPLSEGRVSINRLIRYAILIGFVLMAPCAMAEDECYDDIDCDDGNDCMSDECKFSVSCFDDAFRHCRYREVDDGTPCELDRGSGICEAGECRPAQREASESIRDGGAF